MALVATVTKKSVSEVQHHLWNLLLNMTLEDNGVTVINKDYPMHYRPGDSWDAKEAAWITMMQADINAYKTEQIIFTHLQFDNLVANVGAALEV